MNKARMLALYDQDQRIDVEYPGVRREVTPEVVRYISTSGGAGGAVVYSRLNETNADEVIRAQVRFFQDLGQDFEWKLYDYDRPPDLKARLEKHGFVAEEVEAVMLLDLEEAPDFLWQPVSPAVQRITDSAQLSSVLGVHEQVWQEDPASLEQYLHEALDKNPERMSVYAVYRHAQPVSAAWIYFPPHSQFASLWGGATLSGFRRQGLYTALLAVRAQEARARQVKYLTVDASPMSRPILEKFAFELLAYSYPCKWKLPSKG
jgi:Acetyltransferase (GNAT) family